VAQEQQDDEVFLTLLAQLGKQGRRVSDRPTSPYYAPTMFRHEPAAKGISKPRLESAMRRLFAANKIHVLQSGKPSRRTYEIVGGAHP
jgi:hypothetical protein